MTSIKGPTGPAGGAITGGTQINPAVAGATGFWADVDGASSIWRFTQRFLIGGAVAQNNNRASASQPPPGFIPSAAYGANWAVRDSQLGVMQTRGVIAISGLTRASDGDNLVSGGAPIGVAGFVINDTALLNKASWAFYADVQHQPSSAAANSYGMEIAVKNKGDNVIGNPYALGYGTYGIWFAGGSDDAYGGSPTNPCNAAMVVLQNSQTWNVGLLFAADGLTGSDGVTGVATAISMAKGHIIRWQQAGSIAGAQIRSDVSIGGRDVSLVFDNNRVGYYGTTGTNLFFTDHDSSAAIGNVNWMTIKNAPNGSAPRIIANASADADVDISLEPHGAGVVKFGTHAVKAAEAFSGYITIRDASGVLRKVMVCS